MKDLQNKLLNRREVQVVMESSSNPGFEGAKKIIGDNFKAKEEMIAVKKVKGKFGRDTFLVDAFIYDSVGDKERIEPKVKVKKSAEGAEAKK